MLPFSSEFDSHKICRYGLLRFGLLPPLPTIQELPEFSWYNIHTTTRKMNQMTAKYSKWP
jgi:hypothetical protein